MKIETIVSVCGLRHQVAARHRRYRGIGLVWTAIFILLLILLVGLSLDTAKVSFVYHQMQNTADAAALAGANFVKKDRLFGRQQAQTIAKENIETQKGLVAEADLLLDLNEENNPNGDIVIGWYNRSLGTFDPAESDADAVNSMAVLSIRSTARASLGGPVSLIFGSIAGVPSVDMGGIWQNEKRPYAIAMCAGGTGAGLIALSDEDTGLMISGNSILNVVDGEIQVNSFNIDGADKDVDKEDAVYVNGDAQVFGSALNVCGSIYNEEDVEIPYNTPAPYMPDPLASLEEPYDVSAGAVDSSGNNVAALCLTDRSLDSNVQAMDNDDKKDGIQVTGYNGIDEFGNPITWELYPGYYPDGFQITGTSSEDYPLVHFNPGLYLIGGNPGPSQPTGLIVGSQAFVAADEVTFFITNNPEGEFGIVDIQAGAGLRATEPTSGYYEGITIFQDRDNTNTATINGSGDLDLDGTLYFPNATVYLRGGGNGFGNQLIGWKFDVNGTTEIGINYDGRNRSRVTKSFLVE